jgi:ubiquinone/menaquinone biosynthesis C-methylase UbiE
MKNPSNKAFKKKFENIAENYNTILNPYAIERRKESLHVQNADLILEVGAATGIISESFITKKICTDISFHMCKQAKINNDNVVCCDAELLPFKKNTFNCIISAEMIYYLQNPEKFIMYSREILRKNGQFFISMTNSEMAIIDKIRSKLRIIGLQKMYFDDGLKEFMKLTDLETLLKNNGFEIQSIKKQIIFPIKALDKLNKILEKTPLSRFCIFIIIKALK